MAFLLFISLHLSRSGIGSKKLLPPSPAALPITGHLYLLKPPRYLSLAALAARYGPVISLRLGSRQALIISPPSAIEEALIRKDPIFANHPMVHSSILACGENSLFFAPYGPHWRNLRRLTTAELLSTSWLDQLAAVRSEELLCIVRSMFHGAAGGGLGEVDLNTQIFEMACNAMLKMVVGKRYYGEDVP
ncbi:putative Cytochrome P450 81E8 [Cocos nucifera]|nr:putative Cytochrome P450 81E8 [Cocos nucifera]